MVDNRKCFFRADRLLPRSELLWEYDAQQFDEGVTVRSRKRYSPDDLRQKVESPDASYPRRKPPRRRHRDDDDDDD